MLAQSAYSQSIQKSHRAVSLVRHQPAAMAHSLDDAMELMGAAMPFQRNAEIFGEGEPAEYLYKVVSGAVRTYKILSDGRRQIGGFYLSGEVFGLEAGNEHSFSAEAVSETRVIVIKRSALFALADRDSEIARQLWTMTSGELRRLQDHVLALIKTAKERVVCFLLEMANRAPSGSRIDLPMSRQDIADYLGLTIETVSRTLTQLENAAAITLPNARCFELRDRAALGRLTG
jgi:CRP/FNR family transcriptional regulator, nitrogen fixation regulation protein